VCQRKKSPQTAQEQGLDEAEGDYSRRMLIPPQGKVATPAQGEKKGDFIQINRVKKFICCS